MTTKRFEKVNSEQKFIKRSNPPDVEEIRKIIKNYNITELREEL